MKPLTDESGSIVVGGALVGLVLVMIIAVASVGGAIGAYTKAAAAADAAALAAAPVTFRPFGASGSPAQEAALFARANGATLVSCRCSIDRSWETRTVLVTVERTVAIMGIGTIRVHATSRATFEPVALLNR
ncbi:MAG: Rv3654c family TadE-like protein [Actinomycetota bacterium]